MSASVDIAAMYTQYDDYFRHQATAHPALAHTSTSQSYSMVSLENALGVLSTDLVAPKGYLLRAIEPSYRIGELEGIQRVFVEGGFSVHRWYNRRALGDTAYLTAAAEAAALGDDLIEKMLADSANGHPLFGASADLTLQASANIQHNTADSGYVGWIFLVSWDMPFDACVPAARVEWTDDGLTPIPE